ncbi:MAG: hypothetical protein KDA81_08950, partial [Planctomycetaceae bacterium]|nr:hypothetical protein [Planctomycetaceae bacterium]
EVPAPDFSGFVENQPKWYGYGSPVRLNAFGGENYVERQSFGSLEMMSPLFGRRFDDGSEQIQYFDGRIGTSGASDYFVNAGLGIRHYASSVDQIFDANVWFDADSVPDRTYYQVTAGGQWQSEHLLARGHYYLPIGNTQQQMGYSPLTGNYAFVGNTIGLERYRITNIAYHGFDLEAGLMLPMPGYSMQWFAGYYNFQAKNADDISGYSTTVTAKVLPPLTLGVQLTYDDVTKAGALFSASFEFSARQNDAASGIRHRLGDSVRRNRHIVSRDTHVYDPETATDALGNAINVIHVSSAGNSNGTFESPYANLSQAATDAAASPGSIIFVHAGSILDGQSIVVPQDTRLLGEGFAHQVTTSQLGTITLPRATLATVAPIIRNSPATGPAVTLSDNVEVNGLRIEQAGSTAIFGQNLLTGTTLGNVSVDGAVTGLQLTNTAGNVTIGPFSVANTTGDGIVLDHSQAGSSITFGGPVGVNNAGGHGVLMDSNVDGSTITFNSSLTIDQTAGDGIRIANNDDTADVIFNGATAVSNTTGNGVFVSNAAATGLTFDPSIQFNGTLALADNQQSGFATSGNGSDILIQTLTVERWQRSALVIDGSTGDLRIINPLVLENRNGSLDSTILIQNTTCDISLGDVTVVDTFRTAGGSSSVQLFNNDTGIDSIRFGQLNITSTNGIAFYAEDANVGDTMLNIAGGQISSVGSTAVYIDGLSTDVTLQSVSASNTADGLVLLEVGTGSAFHQRFHVVGDGVTAGSGGIMTGVQRGAVIEGSEDVSLALMNISSTVVGVDVASVNFSQPENLSLQNLTLTDMGGTPNWIGIDINWGAGAHFSDPNLILNNTISGTGADQFGINVVNTQSNPAMELTIGGNNISLTGLNANGISLIANGVSPLQVTTTGDINLTTSLNNIVNATASPFISATSNGADITGQILVNGIPVP